MRITKIEEVDQEVFQVTFEDEFDGSVSVVLFHGKEAFDNYLKQGLTSEREHNISPSYATRRLAITSRHSMLRLH